MTEEELQRQLESIQQTIYSKIPHDASTYFITITLPYKFKTYDIGCFADRMKYLLSKFIKHLLNCKRRWIDSVYDFDAFFENVDQTEPWHLHLLGTFIDQTTGAQLPKNLIEEMMQKASYRFKQHYGLDREINYKIKLVPYSDIQTVIGYCTKELIQGNVLCSDRIYCPQTLFNPLPKQPTKKKNLTKTQRKIRKIKKLCGLS